MPIRYVLVPCKVIGPGLQPSILITLFVSLVIAGIAAISETEVTAMWYDMTVYQSSHFTT